MKSLEDLKKIRDEAARKLQMRDEKMVLELLSEWPLVGLRLVLAKFDESCRDGRLMS